MKASLILIFLVCACSSVKNAPLEGVKNYNYADVSGNYTLKREFKLEKNKLVSRVQLSAGAKILEKSVVVSQLGSIKIKNKKRIRTLRPEASEFTVWLEGKRYFSSMRINPKNKSMSVRLESPEERWNGKSEVPFPKAKYFCFYSQLPECLYHNSLAVQAYEQKNDQRFYVIWDSFPFIQEQLTNVGQNLFALGIVKFEGEDKKYLKFVVELDEQEIHFDFSKSFDLIRMSWVTQGITIVPEGEEIANDVE
ncbi:MAG: hypothetical protein AB7I27_14475 [Bacteriovoracaceae bacterium]